MGWLKKNLMHSLVIFKYNFNELGYPMSAKGKKSATTKTKDVSKSEPAAPELLLELLAGKEGAALARPFLPNENEIEVILERNGSRKTYSLFEVCCILLKDDPNHLSTLQSSHDLMEIETLAGSQHLIRVAKDQHFPTGFYGSYLDLDNPYRSAFFTNLGIKSRRQLNFLGTILEEQGMVSRETLQEVIKDYNNIKKKRIGETIAQKHNLNQEKIEKIIRKMQKEGKTPHSARVGDILIASKLITQEQLEDAIAQQVTDKNKKIGALLVERKHINADQLLSALAIKFQLEFVNLDDIEPSHDALHAIPLTLVTQMEILPIADKGDHLLIATSKPAEHAELGDTLRFITNRRIKFVVAPSAQISDAIEKHYTKDEEKVEDIIGGMTEDVVAFEDAKDTSVVDESDSQIIKLVNKILIDAYKKEASDIHLEPGTGKDSLIIRYRVDGLCHVSNEVPPGYKKALLSRIKIMSHLDITERRRPQSGKIIIRYMDKKIEYRVETTPTVGDNEDAVLRVLAKSKPIPLNDIGFSPQDQAIFESIVSRPAGMILCVGPTGSGKTTTLHSALSYINTPDRKIWTAEDPVEITQKGLRQVQVNAKIGFTFQEAMRSFLRSDPDVIMIGEMRDNDTAKTAIEASLTGHVVFSTLHTNNAPETLVRLVEMGMDRVSFSEAISAVIAQRLVRILCKKCKKSFKPDKEYFEKLKVAYGAEWFEKHGMDTKKSAFKQRVGCKSCDQVGYRGRSAIFEMLETTDSIKKGIKERATSEELRLVALEQGMRTLRMDAVVKCFQGVTDLDEILRVC
jgi:type II secretory ATPase GspE/PulE/Tfp pilus assembly ATPase PilB-like protein